MARILELTTGDVTLAPLELRTFHISADDQAPRIILQFDNTSAAVERTEWGTLLAQVKTRSLARWKFSRMEGPMGEPDFQLLLAGVGNTPAYQLFLAGFDIAGVVGVVSDLDDQVVLGRCISLARRIPSIVGPKGLFFISGTLLANASLEAVDQLIQSNKLCRLRANIGGFKTVTKYYIPYATPIELVDDAQDETRQLWGRIRDYYYAFR